MTIAQAYASASETPRDTIEISHSGLTGGVRYFVSGYNDLTCTLEDSTEVTFTAIGANIKLANRSTDGKQELLFAFDNTSREASDEIKNIVQAQRSSKEAPILKYRAYLPSDLSAPSDGPFLMRVNSSERNRESVVLAASFFEIGNLNWPFRKYDPESFPGVRYA
jgi:hypothetical protein